MTDLPDLLAKIEALKAAYPPPGQRGEHAAQYTLFDLYEAARLISCQRPGSER